MNNNLVPIHQSQQVRINTGPITPTHLRMQYNVLLDGEPNRAQEINALIQERGLIGPLTYEALDILRDVLPGTDEQKEAQIEQLIQQHGFQVH